jgi:hypothetical protein
MSKLEFWTLNIVGGGCALLILGNVAMSASNQGRARQNVSLNKSVVERQGRFENARNLQTTARNLIVRIAQTGQSDGALSQLLTRHDFKVNLNTNSPAAQTP